jgi:hypothetical protein
LATEEHGKHGRSCHFSDSVKFRVLPWQISELGQSHLGRGRDQGRRGDLGAADVELAQIPALARALTLGAAARGHLSSRTALLGLFAIGRL